MLDTTKGEWCQLVPRYTWVIKVFVWDNGGVLCSTNWVSTSVRALFPLLTWRAYYELLRKRDCKWIFFKTQSIMVLGQHQNSFFFFNSINVEFLSNFMYTSIITRYVKWANFVTFQQLWPLINVRIVGLLNIFRCTH